MSHPTLVLLHGYPFEHTMWEKVIPHLDRRIKVVAPDLQGFGQKPASQEEPALEILAADLAKTLNGQGIRRAVLAGFSMGGYVGLAFADLYPDRVAGFALVNSQASPDSEEMRSGRRAMIEKVRREGARAAVEAARPKLFARKNADDPELARYAEDGAKHAGVAGITWALEAMARRPDRTGVLQKLDAPVIILHSNEDQFVPVDRARSLADKLRAAYREIEGAGHCSPLEAPEAVANVFSDFVLRIKG